MLQATSAIIDTPPDRECRFWFRVSARTYAALALAWPLLADFLRIFTGMALSKGVIPSYEANAILEKLPGGFGKEVRQADCVLDLGLALHNRDGARMNILALEMEDGSPLEYGPRLKS